MADFDPFASGTATAVAGDSRPSGGAFDPFAGGKATPAPQAPTKDFTRLYGGLDTLDQTLPNNQRGAFTQLDANSQNPKESRAKAINMAYVKNQFPQSSPDALHGNWESVKTAYAKQMGFGAGEPVSDTSLYGKISAEFKKASEVEQSTGWQRLSLGHKLELMQQTWFPKTSPGKAMEELSKPAIALPSAPKDAPDIPYLGMANPAIAAGVYNSVFKPVIEGLESPLGIGTLGIGGELNAAAKGGSALAKKAMVGMTGLFTGLFVKNTIQGAPETVRVLNDPKATKQQKIEAAGNTFRDAALSVAGALGTAFELKPEAAAAVEGKNPAQAAEALRTEANNSKDGAVETALNQAAARLEEISPPKTEPPAERIQAAAVQTEDGQVVEGKMHADIPAEGTKGFTTTSGRFVDRKEAMQIAQKSGQVTQGAELTDELHSHQVDMDKYATPIMQQIAQKLTGIKNEAVDAELAQMGMEPATHGERTSFAAAVAEAEKTVQADPTAGQKLVEELAANPRPITGNEDALLLHEMTRLKLERDAAERTLLQATKTGDQPKVAESINKIASTRDAFQQATEVATQVGTANAQGLALRRMMLKEDYSLSSMEQQFAAAGEGKPLTEKELADIKKQHDKVTDTQADLDKYLKAQKTRLEKSTDEIRARIAKGDLDPKPRRHVILDEEGLRLKAENQRAKQDFQRALYDRKMAQRSLSDKMLDTFVKWRRAALLSNPVVLAKLTGAATLRGISIPIEEAVGGVLSKLPGVAEVAKRAPAEGGLNVDAMAKGYADAFTQGMKDAYYQVVKGSSDLDVLYENAKGAKLRMSELPQSSLDFFGHIHAALKSPVKRGAFKLYFEKRVAFALKNGVDVSDPLVQAKLGVESFKDAQRQIFMQDNAAAKAFTIGIAHLQREGKSVQAAVARGLFPIVKVPTNIVAETSQYATGAVTGPVRLATALVKGVEKLTPDQADLIMRELKKGSVGAAMLLLGYFNYKQVGGYYQRGEKRRPTDTKAGTVKVNGLEIPQQLMHHPAMETVQLGSTVRRVSDARVRGHEQGMAEGAIAGGLGLTEQIPFARESVEFAKLFDPHERPYASGELLKSLLVPGLAQWIAEQTDRQDGEKVKRKPSTVMEHVETGIPGFRQDVKRDPKSSLR